MNNNKFYCSVCRHRLPTLKALRSHCMAVHTKTQLARAVLKAAAFGNSELPVSRNGKKHIVKFDNVTPEYWKCEILYLEDGFKISEIENEPIAHLKPEIKDSGNSSSSFSDYSDSDHCSISSLSSHNRSLNELKNFRFDCSSYSNMYQKSLNHETGEFYICHCQEQQNGNHIIPVFQKSDLQNLMSDTDTCSDTGQNFFVPLYDSKLYCHTCGNAYSTKRKLIEHFKCHEKKCSICNQNFSTVEAYKSHLKKHLLKIYVCHLCGYEFSHKTMLLDHLDAHIEDDIFDNVFELEQDYKTDNEQWNTVDLQYSSCFV